MSRKKLESLRTCYGRNTIKSLPTFSVLEENFYLVWAIVILSLCHSHTNLILTYITSLINVWYFLHLSVIIYSLFPPWSGTRFQSRPVPDTLVVAQWNVYWRRGGEDWVNSGSSVHRALAVSDHLFTLRALPDLDLIKPNAETKAVESSVTRPRLPAGEWQGWDWNPGCLRPQPMCFLPAASPHRAPGMEGRVLTLGLGSLHVPLLRTVKNI